MQALVVNIAHPEAIDFFKESYATIIRPRLQAELAQIGVKSDLPAAEASLEAVKTQAIGLN